MRPWPLALALLAACGGADEALPDATSTVAPDAGPPCEVGATAAGELGPAGGELTLCGARLALAPGAAAGPTAASITWVEPPSALPAERALAGGVFRFDVDPAPAAGLVSIDVPAADGDGYLYLYGHDGADWFQLEACRLDGGIIGQDIAARGTFAAMRNTEVYPDSPSGLGDGTLDAVLDGVPYAFTLDASSRGIYEDAPAGDRVVTFYLWLTPTGGMLKVLDVRLAVPVTGAPEVIAASWTDLDGPSYSYIGAITPGAATVTLTGGTAGDRYVGDLAVTFVDAEDAAHELTATFDITVEEYGFPPEASCPGGGELRGARLTD